MKDFYTKLGHQTILRGFLALVMVGGLITLALFATGPFGEGYPETDELAGKQLSFTELSTFFQNLAKERGGVYAFEVLKRTELPPNIDVHLLGHIVGDELYVQEGIEGITHCTHDFRNACSHTIVIGGLLEFGEGALPEIQEACYRAPGGKGAYTMCFHGFGHGALAYTEYNLEAAVAFCGKMGTAQYRDREYIECVGGAVMEMAGGGIHDREAWEREVGNYITAEDPLSPCNMPFMNDTVRPICYTYLTPHLFEVAGADLGFPGPRDFEIAFRYCDALPVTQERDRRACFGGFGKEFVVLAQDRDVRKIEQMSEEQLALVYEWCELAPHKEGAAACVQDAVQSLYWGGENDRGAAVAFCNGISDSQLQGVCARDLIQAVSIYIDEVDYKQAFCSELSVAYQEDCRENVI